MKHLRFFLLPFALLCALLFIAACNTPPPAPTVAAATAVAVVPTATTVPPTDAPTAVPPTNTPVPTDTPVPPTATNTPLPPTNTPTLVPPTATNTPLPPTKTRVPATPKPTQPLVKLFTVDWKTGIEYIPVTSGRNACQLHNEFHNNTTSDTQFQITDTFFKFFTTGGGIGAVDGYEPIFGLVNPDGSMSQWKLGMWYARAFGWSNGIQEFPPNPVKAGTTSGDWTWYSIHNKEAGQWCRYVYVKWQGQVSAAEFNAQGQLVSTNVKLPPGAP